MYMCEKCAVKELENFKSGEWEKIKVTVEVEGQEPKIFEGDTIALNVGQRVIEEDNGKEQFGLKQKTLLHGGQFSVSILVDRLRELVSPMSKEEEEIAESILESLKNALGVKS